MTTSMFANSQTPTKKNWLLPISAVAAVLLIWQLIALTKLFPEYAFPSPMAVIKSFGQEIASARLLNDIIASLWRVSTGFLLSVLLAVPLGLYLGHSRALTKAFTPLFNFFRSLSPLAWIPFAILWFHIGDKPAIFLILLATFFPLTMSVMGSVATIPNIYFKVARDYHYRGFELISRITLPAILPQLVTSLRLCYGISWVVIVAAEMVGCQDGLGYGIWDARNSLRLDTAVCYMITIGVLGMLVDRLFIRLTKIKSIKWGYDN